MVSARRLLFLGCGLFAISLFSAPSALAGPSCSGINRIDESFANGARWQLCWDVRSREAVVYREIYYTPPGGAERMVMAEVSLAQIHVPYDDNGARFHDITDFGAGGGNLNDLTNADCPDGALLQDGSKNVICKKVAARGAGYDATLEQVQGSQLELFSVSHVGAYNYIPRYHFMDDGTIEMVMGATGQLQRFEYDDPGSVDIGWPLDTAANRIGISHIHNYYFRMDFDLGDIRTDDVVEQIDVVADGTQSTRVKSVTPFTVEGSADVAPTALRRWRVRDGAINNANGHSVSYELIPLESGHRDEGPVYEPFTHNDFYVTKYSDCEQYASHNNQLLGCGDDLSEFVSGESLVGEDIVVWYGLTFHHIPRDEDEAKMHAHWNGFQLRPRDWSDATPLSVDAHECAPGALDFDTLALEAFADQDKGGTAFSTHEGTTLSMTGNTWKQTTGTYVVGPDTTVEFEFASAEEGEIHSIGFDEDDALNGDPRHFELYGNQGWGGSGRVGFTPIYSGGGAFQSFSVPVGQSYTGSAMHLVFGNDQDASVKNNEGRFRCVRILELASPPVWNDPGPQSSTENDAVSLFLSAVDPEAQTVTYSAVGLPPGLTVEPTTGEVSGTLGYDAAGVYAVVATATDGIDAADQAFGWTVGNLNRTPVWADPGPQVDAEGAIVSQFVSATDPDAESVTYSATGLPPGLAIDPVSGEIAGTLGFSSAGVYAVVATATDGLDPADQAISWTISNVNRAPVWTNPATQSDAEDDVVSMFLAAIDPDGEGVTYDATGLPVGLSLNPTTGEVTGYLDFASAGSYAVMATATDGTDPIDQPFDWDIANTNRAPIWNHPGDPSTYEGEAVSFPLSATDLDGDSLTLDAMNLPPGLYFDAPSETVLGAPDDESEGSYNVTLEADDGSVIEPLGITWTIVGGPAPVPIPTLPRWAYGLLAMALAGVASAAWRGVKH